MLALLLLCPMLALGAQQTSTPPDTEVRVGIVPPSIRVGDVFRAELLVRTHFDFREYDPELDLNGDTFVFRRARVALEGRVLDDFEYELDAELRDLDSPWRDVLINYRRFRAAEVQAGRFKMPFGLEQLTGVFTIPFVERALIATYIAPARDEGVMVHGRLAGGAVNYETGVFRHDGDNAAFASEGADTTWAGRVELLPWEGRRRSRLRTAQFGVNATIGDVPEGLNGLRGQTLSGFAFFDPVYVKGRRVRFGVDGRWTPGPFLIAAEYNRASDQRNGQGLGDVDLPDAVAQGWYLAATWVLTGEAKADGPDPRRDFLQRGVGAIELAARIEELRFGSAGTADEPPFANPRAANILPNRDRILTLGVNWYLNRFARVTVNGTRETIQDPARSPILDRTRFWGAVLRLQFLVI